VPTDDSDLGLIAKSAMPRIEQLFVAPSGPGVDTMALERRAFVLRKRVEHAVEDVYFPSL
jgi:glutamate synthase (NADPH/NADH) large chain